MKKLVPLFEVQITQDDINRADHSNSNCPLARACKRELPNYENKDGTMNVEVFAHNLAIGESLYDHDAHKFVMDFDHKKIVKPRTVKLYDIYTYYTNKNRNKKERLQVSICV